MLEMCDEQEFVLAKYTNVFIFNLWDVFVNQAYVTLINMRAIAVSVWIFINLVFFGMCGYIYLIWSQYWQYRTRHQQYADSLVKKSDNRPLVDYFQVSLGLGFNKL